MAAATPRRRDPAPRVFNGDNRGFKLLNRDPKKWYIAANKGNQETGVDYYLSIGYEIERKSDAGVKWAVGSTGKTGEPLEYQGHILMSIPVEEKLRIDREGVDGDSGWKYADVIEEHILDRSGFQNDLMRGLGNKYVKVRSEIDQLEQGI